MKIREGFVSNSSTSSFIVLYDFKIGNSKLTGPRLTREQVTRLRNIGFFFTSSGDPVRLPEPKSLEEFESYENVFLRYDVTCNQEEVILDLLENKIPFIASTHYDQEVISWDGKSEHFIERPNHMALLEQHLHGKGEVLMCESCLMRRHNVQDFISRELKYRHE